MLGQPNALTALVLIGLFAAILLGLLSYHSPRQSYLNAGLGVLIVTTAFALLASSLSEPNVVTAVVLLLVCFTVMAILLTYQNRGWAHVVWWLGVLLFVLSLPLLGASRGDLALFTLIAGPGLLMLVATLYPEVPARYARLGVTDAPAQLTSEELANERQRYTRLAGGITLVTVLGVFLFGVPQAPVSQVQAVGPVVFDEQLAQQGAQLFTQYGCNACHSTTGAIGVGPTLKDVYNHAVRFDDGSVILGDEAYIRSCIAQTKTKIVNGFTAGVMKNAVGPRLPEITQPQNLTSLVEYVKSLAAAGG